MLYEVITPQDFAGGPGGNMNPLSTIQNSITSAIPYVIGGLVALAAIRNNFV